MRSKRVAVILCGANVDREVMATVLAGRTPEAQTSIMET